LNDLLGVMLLRTRSRHKPAVDAAKVRMFGRVARVCPPCPHRSNRPAMRRVAASRMNSPKAAKLEVKPNTRGGKPTEEQNAERSRKADDATKPLPFALKRPTPELSRPAKPQCIRSRRQRCGFGLNDLLCGRCPEGLEASQRHREPPPRRNTSSLYDQGFGKNPSAEEQSKPKPIEAPRSIRRHRSGGRVGAIKLETIVRKRPWTMRRIGRRKNCGNTDCITA